MITARPGPTYRAIYLSSADMIGVPNTLHVCIWAADLFLVSIILLCFAPFCIYLFVLLLFLFYYCISNVVMFNYFSSWEHAPWAPFGWICFARYKYIYIIKLLELPKHVSWLPLFKVILVLLCVLLAVVLWCCFFPMKFLIALQRWMSCLNFDPEIFRVQSKVIR